jgi:hypothetical protein
MTILFVVGLFAVGLSSCKNSLKPSYPAGRIAESLRKMCSRDYRLSVESRYVGDTLQAVVWKVGLFGDRSKDLQGMRKEAADSLDHVFLCATRIALSTDAPLKFIEVKIADVLSGATITLWRYVPDIRDSMYQRFGDTEYYNRLVVEINVGPAITSGPPLRQIGHNVGTDVAAGMTWDKPLSMAEFLAKQVISRARREGGETLQAHPDLSEPETLGVVIDNWPAIEESGPDHAAKVADTVHHSAEKVLQGYRFKGFHGITLRDSQGVALGSWSL